MFADDNLKFDENGRKLSKRVENTVKKEKLLVTSNLSFFHSVFKMFVSEGRQKVSLCGNGLRICQVGKGEETRRKNRNNSGNSSNKENKTKVHKGRGPSQETDSNTTVSDILSKTNAILYRDFENSIDDNQDNSVFVENNTKTENIKMTDGGEEPTNK